MSRRGSRRRKDKRQPRRDIRKKKQLRKCCEAKKPILKAPPVPTPCPKTASSIVWENIVLHYLYKLKNAWKSTANQKGKDVENPPADKPNKSRYIRAESHASTPSKFIPQEKTANIARASKSQNSVLSIGQNSYNTAKKKAVTIVRNAIEYGQSKGIISKNGKFFWLKDDMQIVPKINEDCMCIHCNVCKNKIPLKKNEANKTKKSCRSSMTVPSLTSKQGSVASRFKYKSKSKYPRMYAKSKMRAHFEDDSDDLSNSKSDKYY